MIVSRIALTRPEMAIRVEDLLVRMGQAGQIRGQVTDDALKGLLQQVSDASTPKSTAPPKAGTKTIGGGITVRSSYNPADIRSNENETIPIRTNTIYNVGRRLDADCARRSCH